MILDLPMPETNFDAADARLSAWMAEHLVAGAREGAVDLEDAAACDAFLQVNHFALGARLAFGDAARERAGMMMKGPG